MIFNISQPIDKLANKNLFIESLSKGGCSDIGLRQAQPERFSGLPGLTEQHCLLFYITQTAVGLDAGS